MTEKFTSRTQSPYRFDVVGSFLRPDYLKQARHQHANAEITTEALRNVEDSAIIDLIEKQQSAGLQAVTDGEFRRSWWHHDFFWGLNGVERTTLDTGTLFHGGNIRPETARIIGEIGGKNHPFVDHFKFVKDHITKPGVEAKQTIPAPAQFIQESLRKENLENTRQFYSTNDDLVEAVAAAYRDVIADLYQAGARVVQFDDCTWGRLIGGNGYDGDYGNDEIEELKELYLDVNNRAIEGKPEDLVLATHVCRGNFQSTWFASGGYDKVADPLFTREKADAYFLEYDSDRAGGFEPLADISEDKLVVLGLVTSKDGNLENRQDIINRINEAAKYVPLNNLFLSPQCGFSSTEEGNSLTEDQQWEKIALIKEIAEEVWG